jgi:hypothetical protein
MKLRELDRDDFALLTQAFDAIHNRQLGPFLQRLRPAKQKILHSVHVRTHSLSDKPPA